MSCHEEVDVCISASQPSTFILIHLFISFPLTDYTRHIASIGNASFDFSWAHIARSQTAVKKGSSRTIISMYICLRIARGQQICVTMSSTKQSPSSKYSFVLRSYRPDRQTIGKQMQHRLIGPLSPRPMTIKDRCFHHDSHCAICDILINHCPI